MALYRNPFERMLDAHDRERARHEAEPLVVEHLYTWQASMALGYRVERNDTSKGA